MLSLLSLPKGKRLLVRAVPMLTTVDRSSLVHGALRHLPHVVASAAVGSDAEEADAALGSSLVAWIRGCAASVGTSPLATLTSWVREMHGAHSGTIIRALLAHPGASDVISAVLTLGEEEAGRLGTVDSGADEAAGKAIAASVDEWRAVTEALGRAFVEAGDAP